MPATQPEQPTYQELLQQNQLLKDELIHAQRLTSMGELVGTTTHEFNNVLMSIINYAKLGLRNKDEAARDRAFDKILSAGQRAATITNTVLAMARNRSTGIGSTDIAPIIEETLVLLEREMQKFRIDVQTEIEPDTGLAQANGNQVQQVLLNLLVNARQAIGADGGTIRIRLTANHSTNTVDLSVQDSGPGIPQDQLQKVFEPYFTTKQGPDETGKGGTGLGLSACRHIIEAHRGRIRVESKLGKGTTFTIRLPQASSADESESFESDRIAAAK
ncbi:MAG: ATP-binding protein [Pirellulaceae bacterium]